MKTNKHILIAICAFFCTTMAVTANTSKDTVILELANKSKIMIITESQKDLAALENYDINQMIKDLNAQLTDSVTYLEIKDGNTYVNNEEVTTDNWSRRNDQVNIKLGGVEVGVDPDEVDNWDEEDWYSRERSDYDVERFDKTLSTFNLDFGVNNWLENDQFPDQNGALYSVKPLGSWYVALNSVNSSAIAGPLFLEWGIGVSWYNWKFQDTDVLLEETDNGVAFTVQPQELNGEKSKLTASFINLSLVPMIDFSRGRKKVKKITSDGVTISRSSRQGFRFGVGGYAGYRLGSHTKFVFKEDGNRQKDKENDNFYLQNFRYGIRAQVGWKGLDFFGMYDINEVFADGRGPQLNAITFGITL